MKYLSVVLPVLVTASLLFAQVNQKPLSVAQSCGRARRLLIEGKYQQALKTSEQALRLNPRSAEAKDLAGQAEFALGNLVAAQRDLQSSLKLEPALSDAHQALGIIFLRRRLFRKAQHEFESVLSVRPDDFFSRYSLGVSLLLQNQPTRALEEFRKAHQLNESSRSVLLAMLKAYMKLNRKTMASATLAELDRHLRGHETERMQLVEFLISQNAYDLSIEELERLRADYPNSFDLTYDLALAYYRAGRETKAAALLRKLLTTKDNPELEDLLGDVEERAGKEDAAVDAFHRATELAPKNEDYRYDFAQALENYGNLAEAQQVFATGIRDSPNTLKMWLGLGGVYYLAGRYRKAAQVFLHAAQIAPRAAEVYVLLGLAYNAAGSLQKSIAEQFSKYLASSPSDATANYYYGKILLEKSEKRNGTNLKLARQYLEEAVKLDPQLAEAHTELGVLFNRERQFNIARKELELSIHLDPASTKAYYILAQVDRKLGLRVQAQDAIQKFEKLKATQKKDENKEAIKEFLTPRAGKAQ